MKILWSSALLLLVGLCNATYSKYRHTCNDIGCRENEECVMAEDVCTLKSKENCGTYPVCKRVSTKSVSCSTYICPPTQVCAMTNGIPRCVDSANSITNRRKRQSYNPDSLSADVTPNAPTYPQLRQTTPSAPIDRPQIRGKTTERPGTANTYRIGYIQPQNAYSTQAAQPGQKSSSNQGYPTQGYQNQGYPNQGYPNQGYSNQGYPSQGYPNQGYPNQGYPNQGYPNQGYPNQGYPNAGYPNQGYPNQGYPNQGYPNQGHQTQRYPNQGYQNQGYSNQGYYPNQGYNPGYQNPGYQNPGYQNQWYPGPPNQQGYNPQGGNPNRRPNQGVFDPILNTLTRTVTQIGANYIKDKIFNPGSNKNKPQTQ